MKQTPTLRVPVFLVPAAVLLAALCLAPSTGWMARMQLSMLFTRPVGLIALEKDLGVKEGVPEGAPDPKQQAAALRAVLTRAPYDAGMQKAGALALPPAEGDSRPLSTIRVERMAQLAQRFPDQPMIYADQLRYATQGEVGVGRQTEQQSLEQEAGAAPAAPIFKDKRYKPEDLARYDAAAAAGEQLDPDNSYFPFMRSVGLFATHRDAEALEAVHRAALKPRWNDYCSKEARGQDLLRLRAYGEQGAISRLAVNAAILYPHFASLRAVGRMVILKAVQAEQYGQPEVALRYRHDLMRCGATMRAQSPSVIGSLVGRAIENVAMVRPGGVPYVKPPNNDTSGGPFSESARVEAIRLANVNRYVDYLNSVGQPDEARWAMQEYEAGRQMQQIVDAGLKLSSLGEPLTSLTGWWFADIITLYNLLWLALLGGGALLLTYKGAPQRQAVKFLFLGFVAAVILAFGNGGSQSMTALTMMQQVVNNLSGGDTPTAPTLLSQLLASPGAVRFLSCALSIALPLALFTGAGIAALARRRKVAGELLRLLPTVGLTLACALVVLYAGCVMETAKAETRINTGISRMQQHEGRYFAELTHEQWPD